MTCKWNWRLKRISPRVTWAHLQLKFNFRYLRLLFLSDSQHHSILYSFTNTSKAANQNFWIISLIKLFLIRLPFFKNIFRGNCWLAIFLRKKCRNRTQCRWLVARLTFNRRWRVFWIQIDLFGVCSTRRRGQKFRRFVHLHPSRATVAEIFVN